MGVSVIPVLHITPEERAALQLLAEGKGTREVADGLRVTEREVAERLRLLFERMGVRTSAEAVAAATKRGVVAGTDGTLDIRGLRDEQAGSRLFFQPDVRGLV